MGLIGRLFVGGAPGAVGAAVTGVAEAVIGNRAARELSDHAALSSALDQYSSEFRGRGHGWFHGLVDGLNRLPRPTMVLGTLGLFVYAIDPRDPDYNAALEEWRRLGA
jgi:hypothetical protein